MKTLLLILGPNGVGKSTAAKIILERLPRTALVDSDWCRAMNPYEIGTVIENIYALIKNYFLCSEIETVVFPYGFHGDRKQRFDAVTNKLRRDGIAFTLFPVIVTCSLEENIRRAQSDMRDNARIQRGVENTCHFYDGYDFPKIDITNMTPDSTAEKIIALLLLSKEERNTSHAI